MVSNKPDFRQNFVSDTEYGQAPSVLIFIWTTATNDYGFAMSHSRIAIVGSRNYPNPKFVRSYVAGLPLDTVIVSGGAKGVDQAAEQAATDVGIATCVYYADWSALGRKAGPIRNAQIVANSDKIVAFWDGESRGTLNTLAQAHRAGRQTLVFDKSGNQLDVADIIVAIRMSGQLKKWDRY